MFGYLKACRAEKRARRQYELAQLESLIAENEWRRRDRAEASECKWCKDMAPMPDAAAEVTSS